MQSFEDAYNFLNKEQKEAVDTIYGPVMVVAGPGTGKTQILALRIANILKLTDVNPSNILALTFTDNAAQNMRDRLRRFIGKDAFQVNIATFHSFCADQIAEYSYLFGQSGETRQIGDIENYILTTQIINQIDIEEVYSDKNLNNKQRLDFVLEAKELLGITAPMLRPVNAPETYIREVITKIGNLKREFVLEDNYEELILERMSELFSAEYINPKTEKPKTKWLSELKAVTKNLELLWVYKKYNEAFKEKGLFDYNDLLIEVVNMLKTNKEFKAELQEKYQFILVDEYQDTNGVQNEFLKEIAPTSADPNIFVVGDDDQAIYKFQGANLENILEFSQHFANTQIITLKNNYRSTQYVLDSSKSLIENNLTRLETKIKGLDKQLKANTDLENSFIRHNIFEKNEYENIYIADTIRNLIDSGENPNEIAIIIRNHKDAQSIIRTLSNNNISIEAVRTINLFETEMFITLKNALDVIADPKDKEKLGYLLIDKYNHLDLLDVFKVINYCGRKHDIFETILDNDLLNQIGLKNPIKINLFGQRILELQSKLIHLDLSEFIRILIEELNLVENLTKHKELTKVSQLTSIVNFVESQAAATPEKYTLEKLNQDLNTAKQNGIYINYKDKNPKSEHSVNVLTAHASKGLEFKHVFLPKVIDRTWGNPKSRELIKLPIVKSLNSKQEVNEEERRLFFVAITRAKQHVHLSYAEEYLENNDYKKKVPSIFLDELDPALLKTNKHEPTEDVIIQTEIENIRPFNVSKLTLDTHAFLREQLKNFKLSASSLNTFLNDKQEFLYRYLVKAPQNKSRHLALGTAVHYALEKFYKAFLNEGVWPNSNFLLKVFGQKLTQEYEAFDDFSDLKKYGETILEGWFTSQSSVYTKPLFVEYGIFGRSIVYNDVPLTGKIDKIEEIDKHSRTVRIIDYKTSSPKSEKTIIQPVNSEKEGDLFRQALFYKLLLENDPSFGYIVDSFRFEFIKPSTTGKFKIADIELDQQSYNEFKQLVEEVYKEILELKFT